MTKTCRTKECKPESRKANDACDKNPQTIECNQSSITFEQEVLPDSVSCVDLAKAADRIHSGGVGNSTQHDNVSVTDHFLRKVFKPKFKKDCRRWLHKSSKNIGVSCMKDIIKDMVKSRLDDNPSCFSTPTIETAELMRWWTAAEYGNKFEQQRYETMLEKSLKKSVKFGNSTAKCCEVKSCNLSRRYCNMSSVSTHDFRAAYVGVKRQVLSSSSDSDVADCISCYNSFEIIQNSTELFDQSVLPLSHRTKGSSDNSEQNGIAKQCRISNLSAKRDETILEESHYTTPSRGSSPMYESDSSLDMVPEVPRKSQSFTWLPRQNVQTTRCDDIETSSVKKPVNVNSSSISFINNTVYISTSKVCLPSTSHKSLAADLSDENDS